MNLQNLSVQKSYIMVHLCLLRSRISQKSLVASRMWRNIGSFRVSERRNCFSKYLPRLKKFKSQAWNLFPHSFCNKNLFLQTITIYSISTWHFLFMHSYTTMCSWFHVTTKSELFFETGLSPLVRNGDLAEMSSK